MKKFALVAVIASALTGCNVDEPKTNVHVDANINMCANSATTYVQTTGRIVTGATAFDSDEVRYIAFERCKKDITAKAELNAEAITPIREQIIAPKSVEISLDDNVIKAADKAASRAAQSIGILPKAKAALMAEQISKHGKFKFD